MGRITDGMASSHAYALVEPAGWDTGGYGAGVDTPRYGVEPRAHPNVAAEVPEERERRYRPIREALEFFWRRMDEARPDALLSKQRTPDAAAGRMPGLPGGGDPRMEHAALMRTHSRLQGNLASDMVPHMRTTIDINDELLRAVKVHAVTVRQTLEVTVEQALRAFLEAQGGVAAKCPPPVPTFRGQGVQSGVDLTDNAALEELMRAKSGFDPIPSLAIFPGYLGVCIVFSSW